ncbi:hypothetical protein NK638_08410 [Psychrobacter sp. A3]|uniref:hypothetical protein n=1 Tax=Psychrobacter sp. A3 TaxID=2992754 RepID=UPI00237C3D3B|nr:hypothetical protein [Psychrobacter sp. A3]MDE0491545.1 hypothetical protein [Psychrobacter sp. A3]
MLWAEENWTGSKIVLQGSGGVLLLLCGYYVFSSTLHGTKHISSMLKSTVHGRFGSYLQIYKDIFGTDYTY